MNNTATEQTTIIIPEGITGYDEFDTYVAQQSTQGGRTHYFIVVPIQRVLSILPTPDPATPFEDNRQVNQSHASKFGDYVRTHSNWHSGPLTARTTNGVVAFDSFPGQGDGPIKFGALRIPRNRMNEFRIIDGQHRVFGVSLLKKKLADESFERSDRLTKARVSGQKDQVPQLERDLAAIQKVQDRLKHESIAIDLLIEDDTTRARQVFVDVADNARGIPKVVRARFDMTKVVNRAMAEVLGNPPEILKGRVDDQKDRITGSNENFIGAGTLAEVIRILTVGLGKVTAGMEKTLEASQLADDGRQFFELLTQTFPELAEVVKGQLTTQQLRTTSLLGSSTMLRILAGSYHLIRACRGEAAAIGVFSKLSPHTAAPIDSSTLSGQLWVNCGSQETFIDGAMAPGARSQQIKDAVLTISQWASEPARELS